MQKIFFKVIFILLLLAGTEVHAVLPPPPPPIFPNSEVSTSKDCIEAIIRTSNDGTPFLDIISYCDDNYIYYKDNKKVVLSNNWNWVSSQLNKKKLSLSEKIYDGNILNSFYDSVSYKIYNTGSFNAKLINYDNEADIVTISGKTDFDNSGNRKSSIDKISKDCINTEVKRGDLIITSSCKEKYVYESIYWPDKILLVNNVDYNNRTDWWIKLSTYLHDKYTFEAHSEIFDDSIKQEKGKFTKKLVNFENENDVVLIYGEINQNNTIKMLGFFILIALTAFYKKEFLLSRLKGLKKRVY